MAITFTGTGGLFTRLGKIGILMNSLNAVRGTGDLSGATMVSVGTGVDSIEAQFQSANQSLMDGLYTARDAFRKTPSTYITSLSQLAQSTLIQMAADDGAIASKDLTLALKAVISQMSGNYSITGNTVTVAGAVGGSNTGNAAIAASRVGPNGKNLQFPYAEVITANCATDSQSGTATIRRESWTLSGKIKEDDSLSWNWPQGSGVAGTITTSDSSTANLLENGTFEDWTSTVPDNWTITIGSGTVSQGASANLGSADLAITGDGSTLTTLTQDFNSSSGTTYKLLPSTVYAVSFWAKVSTVSSLAGVLAVSLVDSAGSVISDAASTANTVSVTLSGSVNTGYQNFTGFFRTPAVLASTPYKIRIKLTTALTNATVLHIDDLTLVAPTQVYTGGPYIAIFPGSTASVIGDTMTATVANNFAGKFMKLSEQWFGMRAKGLTFPFSGGTAISDSLVA